MLLVFGVASSAHGDVPPPPGSPPPVNVLPSTVSGSMPLTGVPGRQQYLATLLYKFGRTPAFWQAVAAQTAGTATPGQITLVQQANGSFGVPATKTGGFLKVVGGVGTAVTGYSIGSTIGHATLELVGFDPDGAVCENTTGVVRDAVAVLTGADCSGFVEMPPTFYPNADVTVVPPGWRARGEMVGGSTGTVQTLAGAVVEGNPSQMLLSVQVLVAGTGGLNMSNHVVYCRNPANGTIAATFLPSSPFGSFTSGVGYAFGSYTHTCSAGWTVYSFKSSQGSGATPWDPETAAKVNEYYAPGTPPALSYPGTSPDPLRTLRCVVTHSSGELTRDSATFREGDGVLPQVLCPDVEGLTVESIEIREVNLEDGSWLTLWSESTTAEYQAAIELAPECSNGTCLLDLRKDSVGSCFQSPTECAGWFADPDKGSKYSCHYGSHAVDLAECTIYAPTFQPGATTTGNVYGDPETGAVVPSPATLSGSDPDGSGQACWPSGWSVFNPLEWVFRPIVCAFTPSQAAVVAVQTRIDTAISTSQPGTIANTIAAADWSGITSGGCQGVLIDMSWLKRDAFADADFPDTLTIANACPGSPLEPYAVFSSVIVAGGVIMACIKTWPALLGRIFNYGGVDGS